MEDSPEDIKSLLVEIRALAKENHRMLRAIRREAWFAFLSKILVWVVVLIAAAYFYQQYLAPYLGALPSSAQFQSLLNSYGK